MSKLETKCLHAGYESAEETTHSHAVPLYRTASYRFDSTEHAANLFGSLAESNISADDKAKAFHNLGNSLMQMQQLAELLQ